LALKNGEGSGFSEQQEQQSSARKQITRKDPGVLLWFSEGE
jgi:hypothetical protein